MEHKDELLREMRGMAAEIGRLRAEITALREEVKRINESPRKSSDHWDPNDYTPDPSWSRGTETNPTLSKEYYGDDERSAIRSAYENVPDASKITSTSASTAPRPTKAEPPTSSGTSRPVDLMEEKKKKKEKRGLGTFRKNKK